VCLHDLLTQPTAWLAALAVLHRLMATQYAAIAECGQELPWLRLVFSVLCVPAVHRTLADGATRAMIDAWAAQADAVLACGVLLTALSVATAQGGAEARASMLTLAMHALARLVVRMPRTVLEEQLPRTVPLVHMALGDASTPVRRACVGALAAAQKRMDVASLRQMYALTRAQENLVQVRLGVALTQHYATST